MTLPREARNVPVVRRTVATALESAGVTDECVEEVQVALSEACTNVFQHAGEGAAGYSLGAPAAGLQAARQRPLPPTQGRCRVAATRMNIAV
jgi:hypothetical protein